MTKAERENVMRLRRSGLGYKKIAAEMGISVNTVKSHCQRHVDPELARTADTCRQCGAYLTHTPHRKKKIFCSDKCRMAWWNSHLDLVQRKAIYHLTCAYCGCEFESYGNSKRKFCSRACYAKARTKVVET